MASPQSPPIVGIQSSRTAAIGLSQRRSAIPVGGLAQSPGRAGAPPRALRATGARPEQGMPPRADRDPRVRREAELSGCASVRRASSVWTGGQWAPAWGWPSRARRRAHRPSADAHDPAARPRERDLLFAFEPVAQTDPPPTATALAVRSLTEHRDHRGARAPPRRWATRVCSSPRRRSADRRPRGRHQRRWTPTGIDRRRASRSAASPASRRRASSTCSIPMYGWARRSASRSAARSSSSEMAPALAIGATRWVDPRLIAR